MREEVIEFLKPDRNKVIFALLYPYIIITPLIILVIYLAVSRGDASILTGFIRIETLALGLLFSIFSYPFVCALFLVYRSHRGGNLRKTVSGKTIFALLFISIIISNPVSAYFLAHTSGFTTAVLLYKTLPREGVQVIDISPDSPAAYTSGVFFGERIYRVEIYRDEELAFSKRMKSPRDFYNAMEKVRVGDLVRFISVAGFPTQFRVEENFTNMGIKVQAIGAAPLPLVEVVEISNPRFEGMEGDKIYEIEVYEKKVTRIKEPHGIRVESRRENLRRYRINNTEDFYRVLNSIKAGETIMFKTTSVNHPGFLIEENITDWGIKVRDITLK